VKPCPAMTLEHSRLLMKLNGQPLHNASFSFFQLRRGCQDPLVLRLQPLSLGFHQRLKMRGILAPQPPVRIARDANGKPLRDASGQVLTQSDRQDKTWLRALDHYHQQVAVMSVVESLQGEAQIRFETVPPVMDSDDGWLEYADSVFHELETAGFVAGDLILLCREICRLSNLLDDHLTNARQNFSLEGTSSSG